MFSPETALRLAEPRPPTPIRPRFSFSLGAVPCARTWLPATHSPAPIPADRPRNSRRLVVRLSLTRTPPLACGLGVVHDSSCRRTYPVEPAPARMNSLTDASAARSRLVPHVARSARTKPRSDRPSHPRLGAWGDPAPVVQGLQGPVELL